jgi:hypothetical protein
VSERSKKGTCKQGENSTSISSRNRFKLDVTNDDYNIKRELECQSGFSGVLEDNHNPQTPTINLPHPALRPKIRDRRVIDHLILYGPKKMQLTNYS